MSALIRLDLTALNAPHAVALVLRRVPAVPRSRDSLPHRAFGTGPGIAPVGKEA